MLASSIKLSLSEVIAVGDSNKLSVRLRAVTVMFSKSSLDACSVSAVCALTLPAMANDTAAPSRVSLRENVCVCAVGPKGALQVVLTRNIAIANR